MGHKMSRRGFLRGAAALAGALALGRWGAGGQPTEETPDAPEAEEAQEAARPAQGEGVHDWASLSEWADLEVWHHWAFVSDGATQTVYVDGQIAWSGPHDAPAGTVCYWSNVDTGQCYTSLVAVQPDWAETLWLNL